MTDNAAVKDSYLEGRRLEARARCENSAQAWLEFAGLKAAKGSYALAALGFLNAGTVYDTAEDKAAAADAYRKGFEIAAKGGLREPALFLTSRLAGLLERSSDLSGAAAAYECLADLCEKAGAFFLAADACEHAAEMMKAAGEDISCYHRPAELWKRNAGYWAQNNNAGDMDWSLRRAELYLESIKK